MSNKSEVITADAVSIPGERFQKGDAESYLRASHRADSLAGATKTAQKNAWGLLFHLMLQHFIACKNDPDIEAEDVHAEALSLLESQLREAELIMIQTGVYNSETVKSETDEKYRRAIAKACRLRVELDATDDAGNLKFEANGKLSSECTRIEKEAEKAEEQAREERTLARLVKQGKAANLDEARAMRQAVADAALEGAAAVTPGGPNVRVHDKDDPLSGCTNATRERLEPILREIARVDGLAKPESDAQTDLHALIDNVERFLTRPVKDGKDSRLQGIINHHGLKAAAATPDEDVDDDPVAASAA